MSAVGFNSARARSRSTDEGVTTERMWNFNRLRHNTRGAAGRHEYMGLVLLLTILGTISAILAIAIAEALVSPSLLFLTQGEWEATAIASYALAVVLYFGGHSRQ